MAPTDGVRPSGRRRSGRHRHGSGALPSAGLACGIAAIAAAPLLVGGVHRGPLVALMVAGTLGLALFAIGLAIQGRVPRMGIGILAPLVFVLVPLIQSAPLPFAARKVFDRNGTSLLHDNQVIATACWPLSLDPPNTRVDVGRAALALIAFLFAYHLASGQSRRHLLVHAIGLAGVAAVAIGLGHRMLGVDKVYGLFNAPPRSLLIGPFVNSNHTAEFLELAAFVCLACSFQRPTALNRIGWLAGTLLCAGGAAATLSRGAVAALTMAVVMFAFLGYFAADGKSGGRRRTSLLWGALLLGLVVVAAAALGAGQLVDRFKADGVTTDVRLKLWREALRVFAAHPFGIGRGAFDRVFPIYRSFQMNFPLRFAFIENEPLQLLIDCGWFFFLLLAAGLGVAVWRIARWGRRDKIEAALVAGLFAVLVHSTVDFGLETLGVLLPFAGILGVVMGRLRSDASQTSSSGRLVWCLVAFAGAAGIFGIVSTAHRSYDNFDALLKKRMPLAEERDLLLRAETTHPLDYYYALTEARIDPLKGGSGLPSPRLHALNRALRLCPFCEAVHADVARNLWSLGLRRQSVLEWRTAVNLQPTLFEPMLGELYAAGAKPEELSAVASTRLDHMLDLVAFLSARGRLAEAFVVLDQVDALGTARADSVLVRAGLQLQAGQRQAAAATAEAARAMGIQDPRLVVLQSRLVVETKGPDGSDEALALLDAGASRYPNDLGIQRQRVAVVAQFKKWQAVARSIDGLKQVLYRTVGSATEAHIAAARIGVELGHWTDALDEYRIALAEAPNEASLWVEFAHAAESAGRDAMARDAFAQAARLSPSPDIVNAQRELEARQARLRARMSDAPAAP